MVAGFRRSISLPGRNPNFGAGKVFQAKPQPTRSSSFPNRSSSPGISKLEEDLLAAEAWHSSGNPDSSSWLGSGLVHLELVHLSLAEFLRIPRTQETLRTSSNVADNLLDDLLLLADAHGSFRLAVVSLQELQSAAEIALRRRDEEGLAGLSRLFRKAEKELVALAAAVEKAESELLLPCSSNSDSEVATILRELMSVTVMVSAAVFRGTAAAVSLATAVAKCKSSSWNGLKRRSLPPISYPSKNSALMTAMTDLGESLAVLEIPNEKIFRSLVNSRVSVLNIMTP